MSLDLEIEHSTPTSATVVESHIRGVVVNHLPHFPDVRGLLSVAELGAQIPFAVQRFFLVSGVAGTVSRGEHAHRSVHHMLVCVHGSCEVVLDDGENRQTFLLNHPSIALLVPPMIWGVQHRFSPDAVLLVLASDKYDPADYIRDYDEFLKLAKAPH